MKKSMLSAAIAASTAALMSSGAMAWDSWDWDGGASDEYHLTNADGGQPGAGYAAAGQPGGASVTVLCAPLQPCDTIYGPGGLQAQSFIIIKNKTLGVPGTGAPALPATDNYLFTSSDYDASGNPDPGAANFGDFQRIWRPQSHGYLPTIFPPAIGGGATQNIPQSAVDPAGVYPDVFDMTTDAEGKIIGGWYAFAALNQDNEPRLLITDWDQRQAVGFANGTIGADFSGLPTITEVKSILADMNAGNAPAAGYGAVYGPNNDWQIQGALNVAYETCDTTKECGQFGKSVPVPAFAAAALGLGLLGITYLTGRRRAIK